MKRIFEWIDRFLMHPVVILFGTMLLTLAILPAKIASLSLMSVFYFILLGIFDRRLHWKYWWIQAVFAIYLANYHLNS